MIIRNTVYCTAFCNACDDGCRSFPLHYTGRRILPNHSGRERVHIFEEDTQTVAFNSGALFFNLRFFTEDRNVDIYIYISRIMWWKFSWKDSEDDYSYGGVRSVTYRECQSLASWMWLGKWKKLMVWWHDWASLGYDISQSPTIHVWYI